MFGPPLAHWGGGGLPNTHSAYFDLNNQDYAYSLGATCVNLQLTEGTCEAWFKCDASAADDQWTLCAKYTAGGSINYHLFAEGGGGAIDRIYFVYSLNGTTVINRYLDLSPTVPKNEWHHWAASRRSSDDRVRFYLDGAPLGNWGGAANTGDMHTDDVAAFFLGRRSPYPYHYTEGWIDEARVWSTIRTDAEILANYDKQLSGNETGLQGYWQLNEDWKDQSPNGYDLTPGSSPNAPTFKTDVPFS